MPHADHSGAPSGRLPPRAGTLGRDCGRFHGRETTEDRYRMREGIIRRALRLQASTGCMKGKHARDPNQLVG